MPPLAFTWPLTTNETVLIGMVLFLLLMIWALTRHRECEFLEEPPGNIADLLRPLVGCTHAHLYPGNCAEFLQNEDFFHAVWEAIDQAEQTVHLETYQWKQGEVAEKTTEALLAAAARGVEVRLLVDARGSNKMKRATRERLRAGGCQVVNFRRLKIQNLGRWNVRDHRKILVIDGNLAFVGGHCFGDRWYLDTAEKPRFRDVTARLQGPVVAGVQSAFFENWYESAREIFTDRSTFPELSEKGDVPAHVTSIQADGCPSSVQTLHYLVIALAKKKIRIQNPYFLPDPQGSKALQQAARRGVDVRIMTPSVEATDAPFVTRAGHFLFRGLLEAGVRIYEYQPTLLHQKTITIDSQWAGIGSSNFDDRSFEINDEITVGLASEKLAAELDEIFESDLPRCEEIKLEDWKKRSLRTRAIEGFFYLFNEQF